MFDNYAFSSNVQNIIREMSDRIKPLEDKPEESFEATIRSLLLYAGGIPVSAEKSLEMELINLDESQEKEFAAACQRRLVGEPLAHITKRQRFLEIEMIAGKEALVPRKETELVGQLAVESVREIVGKKANALVVDICTGSGNLACACAFKVPEAHVYGSDLSEKAISLARKNAEFLDVSERTEFRVGNLLEPFVSDEFNQKVDVMICNPPYISSKKLESMPQEIIGFEPEMAFNGGAFGVSILSKLSKSAPTLITEGGFLCIEIGLGQGEGMIKMFERTGNFKLDSVKKDANGNIRSLKLCKSC